LNQAGDLAGRGKTPGLALREDRPAVHGDRELAEAAPADSSGNLGVGQLVAEADRLLAQIGSDDAATDLDVHGAIITQGEMRR